MTKDEKTTPKTNKKLQPVITAQATKTSPSSDEHRFSATFENVPLLVLRDGVIFPHTDATLGFERPASQEAIKATLHSGGLALIVTQKKPDVDNPTPDDIYTMGTLVKIIPEVARKLTKMVPIKSQGRAVITQIIQTQPCITATVKPVFSHHAHTNQKEISRLLTQLVTSFQNLVEMGKNIDMLRFLQMMDGSSDTDLVDQIASTLNAPTNKKQAILEELEVKNRIIMVMDLIEEETQITAVEKEVLDKTQTNFDKNMKENILRERLRIIQQELGEIDDDEQVISDYEQKLAKLSASKEVKDKIAKEIRRFKQIAPNNPEASYIRNWLDVVFDMPWGKKSKDILDIKKAEKILADSHYGLQEVKDRVLEYIAVLQLHNKNKMKDQTKPTILCFVGPPGVGKTSIGQSIAEAMGRKFTKISLGGVRDEAEIRGHRRTYIGAMPGRIVEGLKRAGKVNPVFMLDELDKLGADYKGDPSSALLEVLDPEQNHAFEDHYLDMPFDLSEVIFIATANTLDIPPALRDRLEIIQYSGYTVAEKLEIAKRYLWKKCLKANNLKASQIKITDKLLTEIIEDYTKEAGVRGLEREVSKLMRKVAREIVTGTVKKVEIKTSQQLVKYLGPAIFDVSLAEEKDEVGVVTGLAWTAVGGDVLFIEAATIKAGKGLVKMTGRLGDVMKESAQTALTYVKAHSEELGLDLEEVNKLDLHLHVPEGAVPKDGPSAGVTMVTAIASVLTGRAVKKEIAMTGEVTLRGKVLRIGGLKEKVIAAHRAGCQVVIIPWENKRDLIEIPDTVKKDIKFLPVKNVAEVLEIALESVKKK